jgi:hypothetical protein
MHAGIWWGNLRDESHFEDPGVNGRIILKWISGCGMGTLTGSFWLRTGAGGLLL